MVPVFAVIRCSAWHTDTSALKFSVASRWELPLFFTTVLYFNRPIFALHDSQHDSLLQHTLVLLGRVLLSMALYHSRPVTGCYENNWSSTYSGVLLDLLLNLSQRKGPMLNKMQMAREAKFCIALRTMHCVTSSHQWALPHLYVPHLWWKCRNTRTHDPGFHCKVIALFVRALLHKCFQDVLGSGQIFWNNGLTHSWMLSGSFCIPLSFSFKHAVQAAHSWASFLSIQGCFAHHLSTLHFAWRPFNMQLVPVMFNIIRMLGRNIWWYMADAWQPEEKVYITVTSMCGWGKFH